MTATGAEARVTSRRAHWRPDVQGLRAIAVVAVIAYHAGLPVPGGFVGVDVFFVISGFVIAGMLQRQWLAQGALRLRTFYWRRFLRLTPALGLMVAVTVMGSLVLLSPLGAQQNAAMTGIGAMLLSANIVISMTTGDYFDAPAAANPLLHTWSLSVEEQFYLVFPAALLLGWRALGRHRAGWLVTLAIAVVSFGAALFADVVGVGPRTDWLIGFYGPLSRAWEFAVGALLATAPLLMRGVGERLRTPLAVGGLLAIGASLWLINDTTPFPGPWTLLPVLGTAAVIAGAGDGGPVARLLGSPAFVAIGDRSYSLYLWHWPIIVFALVIWPYGTNVALIAACVSVLPAWASYRFVEQPLRRRVGMPRRANVRLALTVVGAPLILSVALLASAAFILRPAFEAGTWSGTNAGAVGQGSFDEFFRRYSGPCDPSIQPPVPESPAGTPMCNLSSTDAPSVLILGDSHAAQIFPALAEALPATSVAFMDTLGTPVLVEGGEGTQWVRDAIESLPSIDTVVLTAAWYARGVAEDDLRSTIRFLTDQGIEVIVLADTPDFPFDAASCKYPRSPVLGPVCDIGVPEYLAARSSSQDALRTAVEGLEGTTLVEPLSLFCSDDRCSMASDGTMLYRDMNHLTEEGARRVARDLAERIGQRSEAAASSTG